ncbi:hypothetical protein NLI96_g6887 [Meripilus lineatus]|uniref:F-box domain-containing protein n=1 Tax=Meripilus lineatus TaxID=2056292 RepID=A0AAD5V4Y6_9APHY|nr:hypothetical protein NLI96_g6887 [Physisporinus lineatus]
MPLGTETSLASVTINHLPVELLVEIIRELHRQPSLRPPWYHTTFVCRRWRAVVLGYAPFWTTIETTNLEQAKAYLERSKVAPLDLSIDDFPPEEDQRQILASLLSPHLHQVEVLRVKVQHAEEVIQAQYLGSSFPILKSLYILSSWYDINYEVDLPLHAPRLRNLQVNRATLDWQSTLYKNLESLTLYHAFRAPPTLHQFLDILEACPSLSSLEIDGFELDTPLPQEYRSIRLSHLNLCDISGKQSHVAALLPHIDLPSCELFALRFMPPDRAQKSENLWVLPQDTNSRFPFIRQLVDAQIISEKPSSIDYNPYPVNITLTPEDSWMPMFTVSFPALISGLRPIIFDSATAFIQSFDITVLRVEYDLTHVSHDTWLATLLSLPRLESLSVTGRTNDDDESLCVANLYMALYAECPRQQVACPRLDELYLASLKFNLIIASLLHSALKLRSLLGSRLQILSIDDWSPMGDVKPVWPDFSDVVDEFTETERLSNVI